MTNPGPNRETVPTANEALKSRAGSYFSVGVLVAAAIHFVLLAYFPAMAIADYRRDKEELKAVEVVPPIEIPPPPPEIVRPAIPLMSSDLNLDVDFTIAPTIFLDNPPTTLPPPPTNTGGTAGTERAWVTYEVPPELRNREEFSRILQRRYPGTLRNAGIGGTVRLAINLDERGGIRAVEVDQTSGYGQFDEVAVQLVREVARFSPAYNRDQPVAVWISLPVVFDTR